MEDGNDKEKKRPRSESGLDSPVSDLTRADSFSSSGPDPDSPESKRLRVESDLDSPEVKRIQDDLLNILDDSDGTADRDPAIQGLDSVIRSFEEEILVPAQPPVALDRADAQTELGYLLEASDDELGLPPSFGPLEDERKSEAAEAPATSGFGFNDSLGFDDELPNYDSFELGMCGGPEVGSHNNHENDGQFVTLGGLFDFTDDGGDGSELLWRPESLPAM
ncbi:uncharacterized protein LOC116189120 [Punica granatum]|uniref:Uncharacterized protein LOC116189120 n=2 Tax=Punica granatum TaxID=22663 RepID=A0A6P8BZD1_PUNGR|nr:uncharacterized protein LOC116189120 [Punica granatum]PKI31483.1 hypothetical protein CRG98_048126 [Punica granatum]